MGIGVSPPLFSSALPPTETDILSARYTVSTILLPLHYKNNYIPVPLLPPYPLDGWNIRRAAYTGLMPTWGTSSPKCERTGEDNFHLQPGS